MTSKNNKVGRRSPSAPSQSDFQSFPTLVNDAHSSVLEILQLWGDFPQGSDTPCNADWQHVLVSHTSDLFEHLRFDESDPVVTRAIRRRLACIAATCAAWDKAIMAEEAA